MLAKPVCYVGCPVWACEAWVGSLYTKPRKRWLSEYSSVFRTVEGNSTFYALPTLDTVRRWANDTQPGFRFALKFPRVITHDLQLRDAEQESELFFQALQVLLEADRLGPSILQLPPWFSGNEFDVLEAYLRWLRKHELAIQFPLSVEVRHLDYFNHQPHEDALTDLLVELGIERVVFDSRALNSQPPADEYEVASQHRKPNLPVRPIAIGEMPIVRFIGRNRVQEVQPWIEEWVPVVAEWIGLGKTPYVFTHSPNDVYAPTFARRFVHELRMAVPQLEPLPEVWPGESIKQQKSLF